MADPGAQLIDVVDEEDRVLQVLPRRVVAERHLLHRCTYALVDGSDGRILVHRRTETKSTWPGAYDMLAGGVCDAGEGYDDCVRRELEEELAITGVDPERLLMHRYSGPDGEAWGAVYAVTWDGPVVNQPEEVAWSGWATPEELEALLAAETFCADSVEIYRRLQREGCI